MDYQLKLFIRFGQIGVTDFIQELYPLLRVDPASIGHALSFFSQSLMIYYTESEGLY